MKTKKVSKMLLMAVGLIVLLLLACPETEAGAKTKSKAITITVKKIDQKTAKKVHKQLLKGKAFKLRFKCSEKTFYKKFQKLTKKVAKQTDAGFDLFPICANHTIYFGVSGSGNPKKTGKYTTIVVTKPDCQEYIYGIKFAEQKLRDFTQRVDEIISEMENTHNALMIGTAEPQEGKWHWKSDVCHPSPLHGVRI